jgi:hypothetical protein
MTGHYAYKIKGYIATIDNITYGPFDTAIEAWTMSARLLLCKN